MPITEFASPLTPNLLAKSNLRANKIIWAEDKLLGLKVNPAKKGISVVVDYLDGGKTIVDANVRAKVHEYGGGDFNYIDGEIIYVNGDDSNVYCLNKANQAIQLTDNNMWRFCNFVKFRDGFIAVREDHSDSNVVNELVFLRNGQINTDVKVLVRSFDFVANPVVGPNGQKIAFLAWNHPDMPWDNSELWVADVDLDLNLDNSRKISQNQNNESIFQPMWSYDNKLFYVSNKSGYGNLYAWLPDEDKHIKLTDLDEDINQAQWVFDLSGYAFLNNHKIIFTSLKMAQSKLYTLEWNRDFASIKTTEIKNKFTSIGYLTGGNNNAFMMAASLEEFLSIQKYDDTTGSFTEIYSFAPLKLDKIAKPININVRDKSNNSIHAFYYPDLNNSGHKPLIVKIHGGPTAYSTNALNLGPQFWASHGFNFLDINYRGSFGYGKEYQSALNGNWGKFDVEDAITVCKHLIDQNLVNPEKIAITGSSAGGLTVLNALIGCDIFKAGSVAYGVTDLIKLAEITHKFELHYLDTLIGKLPEACDKYNELSPINNFNKINCPVIFFQGDQDMVVPIEQTKSIYEALRSKGLEVELVVFEGEGHGFRQAENIEKMVKLEYNFLVRTLKLPYALLE